MMSTVGMTRDEAGRTALLGRVSRILQAAGRCAVGIAALGLFGCEQLADLGGNRTSAADGPPHAARSVQPDKTVREAQTLLAKLGYDPGPADGLLGSRTIGAIREYQKAAGLPVDGKVSPQLMKSLRSGEHQKLHAQSAAGPANTPPPSAAAAVQQPVPVNGTFSAEYGDMQPLYTLGDAFVWSSGHVDRVVRVGADNVVWRSTDGTGRTAFRSFTMPPLAWQTASAEGSAKVGINPLDAWPLQPGVEVAFEVASSSRDLSQEAASEIVESWRCGRGQDRMIDVPAGRFATQVVTCTRTPAPNGSWQKRTWYYAPAVRHYVRRDSFDAAGRRLRIRLVSLRPAWRDWPPAARAGLDWAIQDTLSNGEQGIGVEWGSSGVSTKLIIVPGAELKARDDRRCRRYALIQGEPMAPRVYPAIACWDPDKGKWLVPGLDDSAVPVSAVL